MGDETRKLGYYDEDGCVFTLNRLKEQLIKDKGFQEAFAELKELPRTQLWRDRKSVV